jgi:hypothetical protein
MVAAAIREIASFVRLEEKLRNRGFRKEPMHGIANGLFHACAQNRWGYQQNRPKSRVRDSQRASLEFQSFDWLIH